MSLRYVILCGFVIVIVIIHKSKSVLVELSFSYFPCSTLNIDKNIPTSLIGVLHPTWWNQNLIHIVGFCKYKKILLPTIYIKHGR